LTSEKNTSSRQADSDGEDDLDEEGESFAAEQYYEHFVGFLYSET